MSRVFHILTESEPFSEYDGGAISRWTANVVRFESDAIVIAPAADESWCFDTSRVRVVEKLRSYKRFNEAGWHYLPWKFRISILRSVLASALKDLEAGDTVWIHNRPEFASAIEPLIRCRGARLFLHLHNSHLVQWSQRVTRSFTADCYIFVSRYLETEALAKFPALSRTEVLYSGADDKIFFPCQKLESANQIPIVLFASRLVPEKGLHFFLDAMRSLEEKGVSIQGVVVGGAGFGDVPPTSYILEMHRRAPQNVRFEPYCSGVQLGDKFRAADIFCLPSCWQEPLGMAPLEAMACALPIIATNSGGLPETLACGGGILVARESVSELAGALGQLATNTVLRKRLAREAYASFQRNFTWNAVRNNYQQILASPNGGTTESSVAVKGAIYA